MEKSEWSFDKDVEYYLRALERARQEPKFEYLVSSNKEGVASYANYVATCYYLLGKRPEAARFGRDTVSAVLEYYFGDWRENVKTDLGTKDSSWWHVKSAWMFSFQEGLCWASVLGDWASASKIVKYPTEECVVDPTTKKEDKSAYLAVAYFLRGEPSREIHNCLDQIRCGKKEKPKLIANIIESLQANDGAHFQKALEAYLDYFRRREFKRKDLSKLLCYDGTTLLNIGRHQGLDCKIPPVVEDYIIRL